VARTQYNEGQIRDAAVVEEIELLSDGTDSMTGPFSITAVNGTSEQITVSSGFFVIDRVAPGDKVIIAGGTVNDGTYTVATVVDDDNITTVENLANAGAGGTCEIFFPPGSEKVGVEDPGVGYTHSGTYQTLQDHISDAVAHAGGGALTPSSHRTLDQLVHDIAEDAFTEIAYTGNKVIRETIWTDNTMVLKIRETLITYTGNKVDDETITQYDGVGSPVEVLTKSYNYSGNKIVSIDEVLT